MDTEKREIPIELNKIVPGGSVKIMISYDYNHFEVCLGIKDGATLAEVNQTRKDAQRLADEAVRQYRESKKSISQRIDMEFSPFELEEKSKIIIENYPKSEWTEAQKAIIKAHEDYLWAVRHPYNYDDNWEQDDTDYDDA